MAQMSDSMAAFRPAITATDGSGRARPSDTGAAERERGAACDDAGIASLFAQRNTLWRASARLEQRGRRSAADRAALRATRIERAIAEAPSRSLEDMAIKLVVLDERIGGADRFDDEEVASAILGEARRLVPACADG